MNQSSTTIFVEQTRQGITTLNTSGEADNNLGDPMKSHNQIKGFMLHRHEGQGNLFVADLRLLMRR